MGESGAASESAAEHLPIHLLDEREFRERRDACLVLSFLLHIVLLSSLTLSVPHAQLTHSVPVPRQPKPDPLRPTGGLLVWVPPPPAKQSRPLARSKVASAKPRLPKRQDPKESRGPGPSRRRSSLHAGHIQLMFVDDKMGLWFAGLKNRGGRIGLASQVGTGYKLDLVYDFNTSTFVFGDHPLSEFFPLKINNPDGDPEIAQIMSQARTLVDLEGGRTVVALFPLSFEEEIRTVASEYVNAQSKTLGDLAQLWIVFADSQTLRVADVKWKP